MPTTVLHTADTHLGYQQYHKPERERDFMDAFRQTIDEAIDRGVDAYVHAGDLFQDSTPAPIVHTEVIQELKRLDEHDIPFLSVVGNHDRATRGQWIDLFEKADRAVHLGTEPTVVGNVAFYGLDYLGAGRRKHLEYDFEPTADADHNVLVGHAQFAPLTPGEWDLREVLAESNIEFDAILLGDEHERIETEVGGVPVTYSGSTERTATDQQKPRSFNTINIDDGNIDIDHHDLDTRRFEVFDVEMEPTDGTDSVIADLDTNLDGAVVRVNITGDGERISASAVEQHVQDELDAFYCIVEDKREFERESVDIDVSFTDPDEAIDERIEDVRLGAAIRDLEREVRDDSVAKTNLRSRAKNVVSEALSEDPETLERPPEKDDGEDGETEREETDEGRVETAEGEDDDEQEPAPAADESGDEDSNDEASNDSSDGHASLTDFVE